MAKDGWNTTWKMKRSVKVIPTKGMLHSRSRTFALNMGLLSLLILSVFLAAMFGSIGPIGPGRPFFMPPEAVIEILTGRGGNWSELFNIVVWDVRLPRIMLAILVGSGLGVSGAIMQAIFKNPMADPYILGLSSGAALGAGLTLAIPASLFTIVLFGSKVMISSTSVLLPFLTFTGALSAIMLVYNIARTGGKVNTNTLLLSGIAVSAFLGAVVMFMLFISGQQFRSLFFWMLGGFGMANWAQLLILAPVILICVVLSIIFSRDLNLLLMGEEVARSLGMRVEKVKVQLLVISSLLAGVSVAFAGIIGFVGLIIPHMIRLVVGPDHRGLIPASAISGAIFMVWMDTAARTLMAPSEIPVGILTALCGGPFFIYLLRRSGSKGGWTSG